MADHRRSHRHDEHRARQSRSRSPHRHRPHSHRSRSPHQHHHYHQKKHTPPEAAFPKELPYKSRPLTKGDYATFKPLFALYLDIQKGKVLEELDEVEAKGRWKSFLGK